MISINQDIISNTCHYTEDSDEQTILDLFDEMSYEVLHGPDVDTETGRDKADASIPANVQYSRDLGS